MRPKAFSLLPALLLFVTIQPTQAKTAPDVLVRNAVSADARESAQAIAELRSMGPSGLSLLTETYAVEIEREFANPTAVARPEWKRLSAALDAVSQQKDSYLSGLYWYTDFAQAKAAARASGKPILSLRLLGKLSEEFSCANSRFFRTVLYPNAQVSKALRERFILHWQSVRPAPRVTIDFGDGRKLEGTLTGNSIHYILDSNGVPLDALPGLYGPAAFLRSLDRVESLFKELSNPGNKPILYHRDRLNAINLEWVTDIQKSGGKIPQKIAVVRNEQGTPTAIEVALLAMTKMVSEASLLRSMIAGSAELGAVTDEATWRKIAALHLDDAKLDDRSLSLIKRQTRNALIADASKTTPEQALASLVSKLEMNIALDTVRNEYLLHPKIHAWLTLNSLRNVDVLNERVYAELFLTPASDPWLGLFAPDTYTALENSGIRR
ncbi:MAG TPA: hypothetical protein VFP47_17795 [Pyrinomonadaceae bacterium]|nr:hypothetical protein [Pyrinomonadaceae bacterium]